MNTYNYYFTWYIYLGNISGLKFIHSGASTVKVTGSPGSPGDIATNNGSNSVNFYQYQDALKYKSMAYTGLSC